MASNKRQVAKKSTAKRPRVLEESTFEPNHSIKHDPLDSYCICEKCICSTLILQPLRTEQQQPEIQQHLNPLQELSYELDHALANATPDDTAFSPQANSTQNESFLLLEEEFTPLAGILENGLARVVDKQDQVHESVARLQLLVSKLYDQINTPHYYMPTSVNSEIIEQFKAHVDNSYDLLQLLNSKLMTSYVRMVNSI